MGILRAFPEFCVEKRRIKNKIAPFLWSHTDPKLPWNEHKQYLLKHISEHPNWSERHYDKKDIDRLIKEGLIYRYRAASKVNKRIDKNGNYKVKNYSCHHYTKLRLINPLPLPVDKPTPEPYAKRKAGLQEFLKANNL